MRYFERVVVGLAMAPIDRELLSYARTVAELGGGAPRFHFIHVLPPADLVARRATSDLSLTEVRDELARMAADVFGAAGEYDVDVVSGHLMDVLLSEVVECSADLVMVGHRRSARGRRSISRRLAIKAPCSVWMVPEGSPPRIRGVLAAVDLSVPSAQALSRATVLAQRAGLSRCLALHVQTPSALGLDAVERQSVERAFQQFLSPLDLHGVDVVRQIEEGGSVAGAVSSLAERAGCDLVVVGTRGRSPSAAVLLGSESEHVLVDSKVPVLITKEPGERVGVLQALLDREFQPRYRPRFG